MRDVSSSGNGVPGGMSLMTGADGGPIVKGADLELEDEDSEERYCDGAWVCGLLGGVIEAC